MYSSSNIESIIRTEGFYLFSGSGSSMWPLIRNGSDTVEVRPVSTALHRGDVIIFREQDRYVLHRIVKVKDGIITTRGDNNKHCETVLADDVVGVMTGLWRSEKKISLKSLRYRTYTVLSLCSPIFFRLAGKLFWR